MFSVAKIIRGQPYIVVLLFSLPNPNQISERREVTKNGATAVCSCCGDAAATYCCVCDDRDVPIQHRTHGVFDILLKLVYPGCLLQCFPGFFYKKSMKYI